MSALRKNLYAMLIGLILGIAIRYAYNLGYQKGMEDLSKALIEELDKAHR